ncbi:IgGFc-binding protein, partial [Bradyrhizobium sp. NBAIM08]|uniref:IgGFc-binding protein n=1 Tax=Bradyrhizobium sp. NBAIM08 TaxID=2793815 RepID=UPI001CD1B70D
MQQGIPKIVILQKGQVYQIMGANLPGSFMNGYELTGTKIRALVQGKPVAVFAGSSRTGNAANCGNAGRDNDIVQLFPIHIWGKKYLTAPTATGNNVSATSTNLYKITVYDTTTIVKRNGTTLTGLINQRYYQFESNVPEYIEGDKPIMVAQFM